MSRLVGRWLAVLVAARVVAAAATALADAPIAAPPRPRASVVLYVLDTVRADRLGLYGYGLATSPKLDRLARRGLVFDHAYAPGPSTSWSVPAFLASRFPLEMHGKLGARPAERVLAEAFAAAGYRTACLQANYGLIPELGFDRGFEAYRVLKKGSGQDSRYWKAGEVNADALAWIASVPVDEPFFFYTQVMDAHFPYAPPPPFLGSLHAPDSPAARNRRELLRRLAETGLTPAQLEVYGRNLEAMNPDRYDEALAYVTHEFVRFMGALRRLGRADDTFVVLTSDHGEPLGEHGAMLHGTSLYDEQVRVPLIVWGPGIAPGRRRHPVSLVDLGPTLLDLTGLSVPPSFLGRSLARPEPPAAERVAVGEMGEVPAFGVPGARFARHGRWKLITDTAGGKRLFDVDSDPKELHDVAGEHPRIVETLAAEIARRVPAATAADAAAPTLPPAVKKDLDESLRALGYVE